MRNTVALLIIAIITLIIGFFIGTSWRTPSAIGTSQRQGSSQLPSTAAESKTSSFASTLTYLLVEHADLDINALKKQYDGSRDLTQAVKSLDNNAVSLSQLVSDLYGNSTGSQFLNGWRAHIAQLTAYTIALRQNNKAGQQKALDNLKNFAKTAGEEINRINSSISAQDVQAAVNTHIDQVISAINNYSQGNYTQSYLAQNQADEHMLKVAQAVTRALIKQKLDYFK